MPQFLTFIMPPVEAVQTSFLLFAAIGFLGAFFLARKTFGLSAAASLLAGTLFMFNNFYAARMLVGHLTYQPFMLTPALAMAVLRRPGSVPSWTRGAGAAAPGGLIVAVMIQGGAIHVILPALLSVTILAVMQRIRSGPSGRPAYRLAGAVVIGCALCAGKLVAGGALLSHFPRDQYLLPGIPGLLATCWRAAQVLFLGPPAHPELIAVNSNLALERHEWEYGVSVVPLLLMLAWLAVALLQRRRVGGPRVWVALVLLLAVPVALNWYHPGWNGFLKALPVLGSSSNLSRWFAAYILPAVMGGAIGLDAIAGDRSQWIAAAAGVAWVRGGESPERKTSFLKKRSKKLLLIAWVLRHR